MKNQEILKQVIAYIEDTMDARGLSVDAVARLCAEKGADGRVASKTIYNMLKKPAGTTVSTLLKVCDALDLDLQHIFHTIDLSKTSECSGTGRLVYDVDHIAFKGYQGEFHVYFLTTKPDDDIISEKMLVHGTLTFGDLFKNGECSARLIIDTGDYTNDGKPFQKRYEGTLVYSTNGVMFCQLVSSEFGDMWFLVFDHGNLNNRPLACAIGCAATSSSGRRRYPAIHRFCLINKKDYPKISEEAKHYISGLLRVKNEEIIISKKKVEGFLNRDDVDEAFRRNLENHLQIAEEYYALPRSVLKVNVDPDAFAHNMAELSGISNLQRAYHIRPEDETQLRAILRKMTADAAAKEKSDSENK